MVAYSQAQQTGLAKRWDLDSSPAVQWWRCLKSNARSAVSIFGQGTNIPRSSSAAKKEGKKFIGSNNKNGRWLICWRQTKAYPLGLPLAVSLRQAHSTRQLGDR